MTLFDHASAEVISLHQFFVAWYDRATAADTDFSRFESAMGPGMQLVAPSGTMLDRNALVTYVRDCRGTFDGDFAIEIDDIRAAWEGADTVVVTYVEKQERKGVRTARRATALFTASSSTPSGVEWRHLHETWMQAAGN